MSSDEASRAELDRYSPSATRQVIDKVSPLMRRWFRAEVHGLDAFPPDGGALVVSNHSGGMLTPDVMLFGSAFYIFLLRQFYLSLPRELFEAARIDGSSYLGSWWRIALPLTRSALVVVFVFEFKASWTDLLKPLIYLYDTALYTMPRGVKSIVDRFGQGGEMQWELVMAATVILTVPMIVIFLLGQRYFIRGIATTGSKG